MFGWRHLLWASEFESLMDMIFQVWGFALRSTGWRNDAGRREVRNKRKRLAPVLACRRPGVKQMSSWVARYSCCPQLPDVQPYFFSCNQV